MHAVKPRRRLPFSWQIFARPWVSPALPQSRDEAVATNNDQRPASSPEHEGRGSANPRRRGLSCTGEREREHRTLEHRMQ